MKKIALVTSLILILSSCNQAEERGFTVDIAHNSTEAKTLVLDYSHIIRIDSLTLPFYDYFQIKERKGTRWLIGMNRQNRSLDFIPFDDSLAISHLIFEEDGPGSVDADLDIFHFFSEDSIITIQDRDRRINVLNSVGQFQNSYKTALRNAEGVEMFPVSYSYLGQRPIFTDSVWILPVYPDLDVRSKSYYLRNKFVVYDPKNNVVLDEIGAYPGLYRGDAYFDILREPSLTASAKGRFLVTFPADPGIYEYRLGSDTISYHQYPDWSRLQNEGVKRTADLQQFVNHYISSAWFQQLMYDPYREVYYRFAKERQELLTVGGEKNTVNDADWKIFILDEQLNSIGSYELDASRFNPMFSFVDREGLYIYDNQRDDEDQMVLGVFRLSDR